MPTLLELDLTTPLLEAPPQDPVGVVLARRRAHLKDVLEGLALGAADPDVVGLIAHVGTPGQALAHTQEIRDAVRRFGAAAKTTVAWTESFGELGPGTVPYYLATAFRTIWMQPSGDVGLTGIAAEAVFVKEALAKLGVVPQLSQRHEYKNAANMFTSAKMTDPHREATNRLVESALEQVVAGVAETRGPEPERIRELIDTAPIHAEAAREAGLVDRLGYRDEVYAAVRAELEPRVGEVNLQYVHRYRRAKQLEPQRMLTRLSRRPAVAVIHATGPIHLGRSGRSLGSTSIGSDTLGATLRSAARADDVRAVVIRVDSPGGSYVASDAIRREIIKLRDAGKPVVISMGSYAASGGYFISMAADTIVAQPGTLTGSIGVLGGKAVTKELGERLGITRDAVAYGAHAQMFSSAKDFSDSEWRALEDWLDHVYDDFTAKVATDRDLPRDRVEQVARGRVWTGADARAHGLVDELGGLDRALEIAAGRAGLRRDEVEVRTLPRFGLLERLRPAESSEDVAAAGATWFGTGHGPAALLRALVGEPLVGVLTAPVLWRLR